jgi:predicted transcriptional regulator
MMDREQLIKITAGTVNAYVINNPTKPEDVPPLIGAVFERYSTLGMDPAPVAEAPPEDAPAPEQPTRLSKREITATIKPDALICLECRKSKRTLRLHLSTQHGLTADEYKAKWGLPRDYPMSAPRATEARRAAAISRGLGSKVHGRRGKGR